MHLIIINYLKRMVLKTSDFCYINFCNTSFLRNTQKFINRRKLYVLSHSLSHDKPPPLSMLYKRKPLFPSGHIHKYLNPQH